METRRYRNHDLHQAAEAAGSAFGMAPDEPVAPPGWHWRHFVSAFLTLGITATLLAYLFG